jgi:hypothetical protein
MGELFLLSQALFGMRKWRCQLRLAKLPPLALALPQAVG